MKTRQPSIFNININYLGKHYEVKALKYAGLAGEMFYKIALPSSLSPTALCWFSSSLNSCTHLFGNISNALIEALVPAIKEHEKALVINLQMVAPKLLSA